MCSNYQPAGRDALLTFPLPPPTFAYGDQYGEAYPAYLAPALTSFDRTRWTPAAFGLVPSWAETAAVMRHTYNARTETVGEKPSYRHAWQRRQLCIIPAMAFFEPDYDSGKAVRWRIARANGTPFGIAGIWERRLKDDGLPTWSMSMLTINADRHPLMGRFHKPGQEKRSVVIVPDEAWDDWLTAKTEGQVRSFLQPFEPDEMVAQPAPRAA